MSKYENLVHYICEQTKDNPLNIDKLSKIIFICDLLNYIKTGESITNETYINKKNLYNTSA